MRIFRPRKYKNVNDEMLGGNLWRITKREYPVTFSTGSDLSLRNSISIHSFFHPRWGLSGYPPYFRNKEI